MIAPKPALRVAGTLVLGLAASWGQVVAPEEPSNPAPEPPAAAVPEEQATEEAPPIAPPREGDLTKLVAGLAADSFAVREKAHSALNQYAKHHPEAIQEPLLDTYLSTEDAEVRYRLEAVLFESVKAEFRDRPRGFLGIKMTASLVQDAGKMRGSIQIEDVIPDTGAARAGLMRGDNIVAVDDVTFETLNAPARRSISNANTQKFKQYIESKQEGDQVKVKVRRQQQDLTLTVRLGNFPDYLRNNQPIEEELHFDNWLESERKKRGQASPGSETR